MRGLFGVRARLLSQCSSPGSDDRRCHESASHLGESGRPAQSRSQEAKLVAGLPRDAGWQFEPKWDGFRCLAFRAGDDVEIKAKSGKSLSGFFPEVLENLRALAPKTFVLDGELVIPIEGVLSFDALQMRLHPRRKSDSPAIAGDLSPSSSSIASYERRASLSCESRLKCGELRWRLTLRVWVRMRG
jgi:ATP-dependent DNA ligase